MTQPFAPMPFLLLLVVLLLTTSSSVLASSTTFTAKTTRPPFLAHVTREQIAEALRGAREHHAKSVQEALENYPVHDASDGDDSTNGESSSDDATTTPQPPTPDQLDHVNNIPLQQYRIHAPATLPDFGQELTRDVYVTAPQSLLTPDECRQVIQWADDHFAGGEWTRLPSGQYDVAGFWIKNIPKVQAWFCATVRQRLFPLLCRAFPEFIQNGDDNSDDNKDINDWIHDLVVDNAYLFKYDPASGRRTDVHTDSGCLSFTIALNDSSDYKGGGTWFDGLHQVKSDNDNASEQPLTPPILEMTHAGQVTIRPGGVKHCGNAVESGTRYIIGGFCMHRQRAEVVRQLMARAQQSGHVGDHVPALEAAICLNPNFDAAYNLLAVAYAERAKAQGKENDAAVIAQQVQVLEYCLQHVHPYAGDVAYALGSLYKDNLQDLNKAKQCFETCLQADAMDVEAMVALMMVAAELGNQADEAKYARQVIDCGVASDTSLGQAYCNLGVLAGSEPNPNVDQEIHYYRTSLQYNPNRLAPRYSLASALAQRRQWRPAAAEYRTALDLADDQMTPEQRRKTLQHLYTVTGYIVQEAAASGTQPSREDMMQQFYDIMGEANFQEFRTLMMQQQQQQQQQ